MTERRRDADGKWLPGESGSPPAPAAKEAREGVPAFLPAEVQKDAYGFYRMVPDPRNPGNQLKRRVYLEREEAYVMGDGDWWDVEHALWLRRGIKHEKDPPKPVGMYTLGYPGFVPREGLEPEEVRDTTKGPGTAETVLTGQGED